MSRRSRPCCFCVVVLAKRFVDILTSLSRPHEYYVGLTSDLHARSTIYGSNSLQAVRTASIMQRNRGSLRRLPRNGSYFDSHGALMNPN